MQGKAEGEGEVAAPAALDARGRLLEGIGAAVAEVGYASTTIADIVGRARVSKRTFYEHFADKEACFLASYAAAAEGILVAIAASVEPGRPLLEQIHEATSSYLRSLAARPSMTRTFIVEVQAAGPRALAMRRQVHRRFADLLVALIAQGRARHPEIRPLSPTMAMAIVGGIHEVVLGYVEEARTERLTELAPEVSELVAAVILGRP